MRYWRLLAVCAGMRSARCAGMLTIHVYYGEKLTGVDQQATWLDALTLAYAVVRGNPSRVVHVFPTGSTSGLYIARHDDEQRRYSDGSAWQGIEDAAQRAKTKFGE